MEKEPSGRQKVARKEVPPWLAHGEITFSGQVAWSSNYTFLVTLKHRGSAHPAVYKPRRGETPLWDFPNGTLHRRELAAYLLSLELGWPRIPPTIVRQGPLGIGSLQMYVDADAEANYFSFGDRYVVEMQRIALFDCLVNNADRKAGHCLLDREGNVWAIDHGLTFHSEPKLRTVIWDFAGQDVPPALLAEARRVRMSLAAGAMIRVALEHLLAGAEVRALVARIDVLLERGLYPHPGPHRSIPWPPV